MLHAGWAVALAIALQASPPSTPTAWTDDRPFTRLFHNLGRDLVALPSLDTARVLGSGGAGTLVVRGADDNLADWATREGASAYSNVGILGDGWVQGSAAVGAYALGRLSEHPQLTHIGSDLVRAQVLNAVITRGLKAAVGRARPSGGRDAFPSGHASATFTSAGRRWTWCRFFWRVSWTPAANRGTAG